MNEIWANRLIAGTQTFEKCKKAGREQAVELVLRERVLDGKLSVEQYLAITGNTFSADEGAMS